MSTKIRHTRHDPAPDAVAVRDIEDGQDGLFTLRIPVSSTGPSRNDGDEAFSTAKLRAVAEGFEDGLPAFLDHGESGPGDKRYSTLRQIGTWREPQLESTDSGETLLVAEAAILDPAELDVDGDLGEIRSALNLIKARLQAGIPLSASIGWTETGPNPEDVDVMECSLVGIGADPNAQQEAPLPAAARSALGSLPRQERGTTRPDDWGLRGHDPEPTDEEHAREALDVLEHVRSHHTRDDDSAPWERRESTPPALATIDELRCSWGHDRTTVDIEERLDELTGDATHQVNQREDVLARLDELEEHVDDLAKPVREYHGTRQNVTVYPFGRSKTESRERLTDAIETLRDLLVEDDPIEGWGMAALEEQ